MARKLKRYGAWAGNPKGTKEDLTHCVKEIFGDYKGYQCSRKRGHGPEGLYCKQHDPEQVAKKNAAKTAIWEKEYKESNEKHVRRQKAIKLIEGIPTEEIENYKLVQK